MAELTDEEVDELSRASIGLYQTMQKHFPNLKPKDAVATLEVVFAENLNLADWKIKRLAAEGKVCICHVKNQMRPGEKCPTHDVA